LLTGPARRARDRRAGVTAGPGPPARPAQRPLSRARVPTILITRAAWRIVAMLRPRQAPPRPTVRLLRAAPLAAAPGEHSVTGCASDPAGRPPPCGEGDRCTRLAALCGQAAAGRTPGVNIEGPSAAFEAARRAGAPRVIYASSHPAVGFARPSGFPVPDYAFPA